VVFPGIQKRKKVVMMNKKRKERKKKNSRENYLDAVGRVVRGEDSNIRLVRRQRLRVEDSNGGDIWRRLQQRELERV